MAKKKLIELNRGKCIASLLCALLNLKKSSPSKWGFLIKLNLIRKCILSFEKLAIFAGLTVSQLVTGLNLNADANKLSSTIFADFDRDGDLDVAEITKGTGFISYHEKKWNEFKKEIIPFANFSPDLLSEVSNNSKYYKDLLLLQKNSGKFAVLSQNGSEGFVTQDTGVLNAAVNDAIIGDFDQDGDDDLVYASSNGTIGWVKNNGTEGFIPQGSLISGLNSNVSSIDLIDYDSHGDTDVKFNSGGLAQLQQNNGSEGFTPNSNYNSSEDYHFLQGDVNNDGYTDSMTVSATGQISVSKSQGTEGFSTQNSNLQTSVDKPVLNDLDGDGKLDLVYTTPQGLAWAKNEGSDGFIAQQTLHAESTIENFEISDSGYSNQKEIYFSDSDKLGFSTLKNNGSENFELQSHGKELAKPQSLEPSIAIDIDGDGSTDLASVPGDTNYIEVHQNKSLNWQTSNSTTLPFNPDSLAPIDYDSDGENDLFALNQTTGDYAILQNRGSEGFEVVSSGSLDSQANHAVLADIDADGDQDLVYVNSAGLAWAKNESSDGFTVQGSLAAENSEVASLEVSDFDEDGDHDLFYSTKGSGVANILKKQGTDGFIAQEFDSGLSSIEDFEISDLDRDGDEDIIFASSADSKIGYFNNNGSDGFVPGGTIATGISQVDQIKVADLDLDNDMDIVAASAQNDQSYWIKNSGSDGFIPHQLG